MIVDAYFPIQDPSPRTYELTDNEAIQLLDGFMERFCGEPVEVYLMEHSVGILATQSDAALSFRRYTHVAALVTHLRSHLKNARPSYTSNLIFSIGPSCSSAQVNAA